MCARIITNIITTMHRSNSSRATKDLKGRSRQAAAAAAAAAVGHSAQRQVYLGPVV
jgi:hypothetical protein